MENANIVQVRYDKEGCCFVLDLDDGMSIVYNPAYRDHAVRVVETDSLNEET